MRNVSIGIVIFFTSCWCATWMEASGVGGDEIMAVPMVLGWFFMIIGVFDCVE